MRLSDRGRFDVTEGHETPAGSRPRIVPSSAIAVLAIALSTACEQRDPTSRTGNLSTTFDTVNGVVHVTTTGTPPAWRLTPVVSIGPKSVQEQETPDEFGWVSAVALGPGGNVFVADAGNHEIRVFGLDGAHLRTFGRGGEGPGEFASVYSIAWVGDRLLTYDPHLGRIGEFSGAGEWLGQRRTAGGMTGSAAFMRFFPVGPDEVFRLSLGGDRTLWAGLDSRGDTGDTVPYLRSSADLPGVVEVIVCEWERGIGWYPHTSGAKFVQHPGSGGVMYSAWGYFYRIAVTRGDGDTLRVIERTLPTEPVTDEEWAAGSAEYDEARERWPEASCKPRSYNRPERASFISEIFVSPDGRLWVDVIRTAGNRWEFFDPEGRLLGSVPAVPYKERTVPVFQGDYLATIRQDDLELDHVDIWRLERVGTPK